MDRLNDYRTARVAEVLDEFRTTQYYISAVPSDPPNSEDYYTEGWAALRQCSLDGQHILNCAADTSVPQATGGDEEQAKAELKQYDTPLSYRSNIDPHRHRENTDEATGRILLDAYARRHEAQKIYRRQEAAQRWIENREMILQGQRPDNSHRRALRACDVQLRTDLSQITDNAIYQELQASDMAMGRWTAEDPSLRTVQHWVRGRPQLS
ncbi:uncharacterized protein F4822DRAFT_428256 [Hypoxylon trugodes]|uniref:uncharacterized protein n=1 Tax=Hypoxylon trugodes TaxID=326681 RepID=UPI0021A1BBBA|nr:uncharacterized protein F4822DRAFT_428256 [Hypoxylon trugodes]KAI1389915.1 hypothetical protein F4822DRAFT_428256 [Hypoxylon trugodes]